ncbi:hypothetical protein Tco_0916218, partial [Tanacetum coccineum]
MENYKNVSQDIRDQLNAETEAVQIILTGIDNNIYSTVDACPNACEMWKAIERLKQGESINVQDLETNLYWEFGKFTSQDGESLESYYLRFYKMMNELVRNQCHVTNHQVNVQFLLQLQPEWQRYSGSAKSGIQCYNCTGNYGHVSRECRNLNEYRSRVTPDSVDYLDNLCDEPMLSKNRNKFLESSNKGLVDKLKGGIEDFKTKNKSLESSNNHFKEANNELSKTNQLMFKDLKKFQAELDKYNDVNYASKVKINCAKAKGDLMSYKIDFEKLSNTYTKKINDLNQTISDMKKELCAHQETISIMSQAKEAQIKLYKTREDKELDKVIALENKVKVLNDIVYKTGQSVQTMNMLNRNCKTSFAKPEFLKKAQRANPRLYDIGCYNDNLALMLAPDSDETIRLDKERRSKLSDLIRPFDYAQLNNLYDLFVPQREKSAQHNFPKMSTMSQSSTNNEFSKESFRKQPTLLEKRIDESIPWDKKCQSSKELFKIKKCVGTIFDGVERCKQTIAKRTYF